MALLGVSGNDQSASSDVVTKPSSWIGGRRKARHNAKPTYIPEHQNPFRRRYMGNPFYLSLEPRFRECVLFFDETEPLVPLRPGQTWVDNPVFLDLSTPSFLFVV